MGQIMRGGIAMTGAVAAVLALAACMPEPQLTGARAFQEDCAICHGAGGLGNGPAAEGLDPPPANLTLLSVRNGGVFPRDHVMSTIDGYQSGTHADRAMPVFGDRDMGETVIVENPDGTGTPVPERLLLLADYLESIQQ